VLLDTHVLLFALSEPDRLSNTAVEILQDASQELVVSSVSVFEIAWKSHRGTLPVPRDFVARLGRRITDLGGIPLAITHEHALRAGQFTSAHSDPFDRMLAAQADLERLPLVSADSRLRSFGIECLW
jgi:PIN domain nuclease of toxin-antitoxin system